MTEVDEVTKITKSAEQTSGVVGGGWKISDRGDMGVQNFSFALKFPRNGDFYPYILHSGKIFSTRIYFSAD